MTLKCTLYFFSYYTDISLTVDPDQYEIEYWFQPIQHLLLFYTE